MNVENSYAAINSLAVDFEAHRAAFQAPTYSESQLRTDFLNKFFTALGWDVDHIEQKNPFQQEVKVEKNVANKEARRRADYAFFVAPNYRDPRFYVEAKKPSAELATSDNYFQAIRYGWNSQTPIVVLTNFHETHVLDCRYKPDIETALQRRLRRYSLNDLRDREKFAELYYLVSREAVAEGSIENFSETLPKRRGKSKQLTLFKGGYQRMDRIFLAELDEHREDLARNFRRSNPALDGDALTEITQRVLDRLIFIRFLEDKLIEPEYIVSNLGSKNSVWEDFVSASRRLDGIYNGIVFKKHPLLDGSEFNVDDAAFGDVVEKLAHLNSPYDFNVIPIHILGSIYERFLGNVIAVTPKSAKLEEKPEIRKQGGVFYTPQFVVRWLVKESVGRSILGKTPSQIAEMRFCDIACGSGSFLLHVYEVLLDYHRAFYLDNPDRAKKDGCIVGEDGKYHLSLAQKRAILVNNIYGVDLDPQAVEVAQLSLYLKLLEEETISTARHHQLEFKETILPSLTRNIISGNSLIELDVLNNKMFEDFEEERQLRPIDLKSQFAKIMAEGGFDVIVGNPPYVRPHNLTKINKEYFWQRYPAFKGKADIYACFIQRSTELLKPDGCLAYIVSKGWLTHDSFDVLRRHILESYQVTQLIDYPRRVFEDAAVETVGFVFQRELKKGRRSKHIIDIVDCRLGSIEYDYSTARTIPQVVFDTTYKNVFDMSIRPETEAVKVKMRKGAILGSLYDVMFGLKTADDRKFLHSTEGKYKDDKPILRGEDVSRYGFSWKGEYVWYVPEKMRAHRSTARPGEAARFEQPKVLVKDTTTDFACTYEPGKFYVKDVLIVLPKQGLRAYDLRYVAAVINSRALRFYYRTTFKTLHVQNGELASLPLPTLDLKLSADKTGYDQVVALVDQIIDTKHKLMKAKTDNEAAYLERRFDSLDERINQLVSAQYGLTSKDVETIDAAMK